MVAAHVVRCATGDLRLRRSARGQRDDLEQRACEDADCGLFPETARFSAYSVANGKPAPDLFRHAAASIGVEPAGCVVVADAPSGVSAAVAANMRVFGYAADSDEQALRDAGATAILRSLDELPQIIGLDRSFQAHE